MVCMPIALSGLARILIHLVLAAAYSLEPVSDNLWLLKLLLNFSLACETMHDVSNFAFFYPSFYWVWLLLLYCSVFQDCNDITDPIQIWKISNSGLNSFLFNPYLDAFLFYFILFILFLFINNIVLMLQGNRRETRLLGILSFVHSTVWKVLFGKVSNTCFHHHW